MNNNFWLLGIHRKIIEDGNHTQNQYDLIEGVAAPGIQTPPHIHHRYTETEYVLEGELTIYTKTATIVLKPGEAYTIPRGTPHSLSATGDTATKTITVFSPGYFAQVIRRAGIPGDLNLGPPDQPTNMDLFNSLSGEIGDVTLGSPGTHP